MDLLQTLRQVEKNKSSIKLLNIYKGLPISYSTNILSVGASEIVVPGNKNHIACLYYQGESYLLGDELPTIVRSQVKSLNLAKDHAILENFEIAQTNIGNRAQIRVEPDDPLVVGIQFKSSPFEFLAPLADISASGASFFFEGYIFPSRLSQPGSEFTMTISIPDFVVRKMKKLSARPGNEGRMATAPLRTNLSSGHDGQVVINANGRVIAVRHELELDRFRVSAQVFFKDLSRMVILQYISHRQTEIINELRLLSEDLYNGKNK
jgi:hypothetical protein